MSDSDLLEKSDTVLPVASPYDAPMDGWMLLGDVVIWIATGGVATPSGEAVEHFQRATAELVEKLALGHLFADGKEHGSGNPTQIPAPAWRSVRGVLGKYLSLPGRPALLAWLPGDEDDPDEAGANTYIVDGKGVRWTCVEFQKKDIRQLWPGAERMTGFDLTLDTSPDQAPVTRRGGRPREWDWDGDVQEIALNLLRDRGLPDPNIHDPAWKSNADVARAVQQACMSGWRTEPAFDTVRKRVPGWIELYQHAPDQN